MSLLNHLDFTLKEINSRCERNRRLQSKKKPLIESFSCLDEPIRSESNCAHSLVPCGGVKQATSNDGEQIIQTGSALRVKDGTLG